MANSYFPETLASPTLENEDVFSPITPSTPGPTKSSALQTRITTVLSASYADLEIRDALAILDTRGLQNTAETRRNLRLDAQQDLVQCNAEIVRDFGQVAQQLNRIGAAIANLNRTCADLKKCVGVAQRHTAPMLQEGASILVDKQQVETKQQLLDAFHAHFVVSDADLAVLTSTAEPVNDDFFRVLAGVKKIHQDSHVLLGAENQRLGLEILEQSSRQLNAAFQKLYRWIQREFKSLDLENPQISARIRRALRVLAERPSMFEGCLDYFAEARERVLSNHFYAALTGAPVDQNHPAMGQAIELSAHDPLRYVSDMLAWAHSATVSEREALEALFISEGDEIGRSMRSGMESEPWTRRDGEEDAPPIFDGRKSLNHLVERDLADVFRQLKQRTEQVIQSHEDATLSYKITNLVLFYCNIFSNLLGSDSELLATLQPLSDTAMRSFRATMRDQIANLQVEATIATADLAPPDFLLEALETLQVLMKSYDTSVVSGDRATRSEAFQPILEAALDPFLAGCENMTQRLRAPNDHIFALNCLLVTRDTLQQYSFADRSEDLRPRIEQHETDLMRATHDWFSEQSGLKSLTDVVAVPDDLASFYTDSKLLVSVAQRLDAFLPTATEDARAFLAQLEDKMLMRRVVEVAADRFCEDFEEVEGWVLAADLARGKLREEEGEGDGEEVWLRELFPRTVDEIRVLLS